MNRHEHAHRVRIAAEDEVISLLQNAGYDVGVEGSIAPLHLTINENLIIAVKGATWTKHAHSKGRYQFNIHGGADVYVLCCIGVGTRFFVIPGRIIENRENVAIWSRFPNRYVGRWTEYCDAWNVIDEELERCKSRDTA